jgi:hypothetical protein
MIVNRTNASTMMAITTMLMSLDISPPAGPFPRWAGAIPPICQPYRAAREDSGDGVYK